MSWDNPFSPDYWENCTTPDSARERLNKLERICEEHPLADLQQKIGDRSARILEVGCGNGVFLDTLLQAGFQDIRGIDMYPRHIYQSPHLDKYIEIDCLQLLRGPIKKEERFDIVCSHLVFDESAYRDQKNSGFRDAMLEGIYSFLSPSGLYFASERHNIDKIRAGILNIEVRGNTYLGEHVGDFIPAQGK